MLRRPPGERRVVAAQQRARVLLALVFLLPWIQLADAQQQHSLRSPQHAEGDRSAVKLEGTISAASVDRKPTLLDFDGRQPLTASINDAPGRAGSSVQNNGKQRPAVRENAWKKSEKIDDRDDDNSHALATSVALDDTSVRAPIFPRQLSNIFPSGAGLSSPQSARSLDRWAMEDYVLVATVDGHLRAVHAETGIERWHLQTIEPAIETIHHRPNNSQDVNAETHVLDGCIWAIEPSLDGPLYLWRRGSLTNTGLTMKSLVDVIGPSAIHEPPIVYTGDKKTTLVSVDAATGNVIRWYGHGAGRQPNTCVQPNQSSDFTAETCTNEGIISLKRTEYVVTIQSQEDGRPLATLKYIEWGPNGGDTDLHEQFARDHDGENHRYITSHYDGKLYSLDTKYSAPTFGIVLPMPTYRVFHVAKPGDAPSGSNPELLVLPQPEPRLPDSEALRSRLSPVLLNQTETGGWYAMSGTSYPLVVEAPRARSNKKDWAETMMNQRTGFTDDFFKDALIGTHALDYNRETPEIGGHQWPDTSPPSLVGGSSPNLSNPSNKSRPSTSSERAVGTFLDLLSNNLLLLLLLIISFLYLRTASWAGMWSRWNPAALTKSVTPNEVSKALTSAGAEDISVTRQATADAVPDEVEVSTTSSPAPPAGSQDELDAVDTRVVPARAEVEVRVNDDSSGDDGVTATVPTISDTPSPEPSVAGADAADANESIGGPSAADGELPGPLSPAPEKKGRKRGKRGGQKHKKPKDKQFMSQGSEDHSPDEATANDASRPPSKQEIEKIMSIPQVQEAGMKPDIKTIGNPEDVSQSSMDLTTVGLIVNTEEQLGIGSQGTVVFSGTFFGREVAVKRMLSQFTELATQETKLLLESDSHPNVIQYYAMHEANPFLYIALERCDASLADIVDKPQFHPKIAAAGERDIPNILLQIANGLGHLHDLRIVHRDLKPQNILVSMKADGKPRMLVSDFGLCKKLDGAQSSFGATTAHAAGTSGWRAPELLLDDDARETNGGSASMASSHSESSQLVSSDVLPNRRATRAIDVFSLGLVFFYVLTKGSHPFDCGDRYMREVNIRKGHLNLTPLEVLGDYHYEAQELIRIMLASEPRRRPSVKVVMSHPFFWNAKKRLEFLCNVSDHFEKECRDPPSSALQTLEGAAPRICRADFMRALPKDFVESLGKQRKYTGTKLLDLLRAFRNKWYHRNEMSETLKKTVGTSYEEYLGFWTRRFPNLLVSCFEVIFNLGLQEDVRFEEYFEPMRP